MANVFTAELKNPRAIKMKNSRYKFALIEIAKAEGITITLENVYPGSIYTHDILKARHNVLYSKDYPKIQKPSLLEEFANVDDVYLKRAPKGSLEGQANIRIKKSEHIEREVSHICPPVYDRAYVERSEFTITDLYNDIVSLMEWYTIATYLMRLIIFGTDALTTYSERLDWGYYREQRRKFRKCRYKFCLNMYAIEGDNIRGKSSRRADSRFCCEQCRKAEYEANKRFEDHGSYLPVKYYEPYTDEYIGDRYRNHEAPTTYEKIERQQAKRKVQSPVRFKEPKVKHGKVVVYKSLEEAEKAYENADFKGFSRRNFPIYSNKGPLNMPIKILGA